MKAANDSWRVDETYITIDFYLRDKRNAKAAKRFLKKSLASCHAKRLRSITADGDKAYPVAIRKLKDKQCISHSMPLRVKKYLNNIIEQDYRFINKRIRNILGLKSLQTATKMIAGIEAMHMIKKDKLSKGRSLSKGRYILSMKSLV